MKLWMTFFILNLVVLYYFYKKREENENYLFIKLIGYSILGGFTFSINEIRLPLGFVVYLLFFARPKLNKSAKQRAAYLGLFIFIIQLIVPSVDNNLFERPRTVVSEGRNVYGYDFEKNWLTVTNKFKVDPDARMEKFEVGYHKNGEFYQLRYEFIEREQQGIIYYRVKLNLDEHKFTVERERIKGQWLQYDRSVTVSHFFEQLNDFDLQEIKPKHEHPFYALTAEGSQTSYMIKEAVKYVIQGDQIIELKNSQLPVTGFMISACGGIGEQDHFNCEERADYFYDAAYNMHDEVVTEEEILKFAEEDDRVMTWLENHTGERIGKKENVAFYLKQDGEWSEVSEGAYIEALKTTPHVEKELRDEKWHVVYENPYGDIPHKLEVVVDAKTGEILSVKEN